MRSRRYRSVIRVCEEETSRLLGSLYLRSELKGVLTQKSHPSLSALELLSVSQLRILVAVFDCGSPTIGSACICLLVLLLVLSLRVRDLYCNLALQDDIELISILSLLENGLPLLVEFML